MHCITGNKFKKNNYNSMEKQTGLTVNNNMKDCIKYDFMQGKPSVNYAAFRRGPV